MKPEELADAVRRLRLFNEKADKLTRSRFVEQIFNGNHQLKLQIVTSSPVALEKQGADEDAIDAVALTLRFFLQPRDHISISQMKTLYGALPIPDAEKQMAKDAIEDFEKFLGEPTVVKFKGEVLTRWRLIEVFLYGDLAHANPEKQAVFELWRNTKPFDMTFVFFFEDAVAGVIAFILEMKNFNDHIMAACNSQAATAMEGSNNVPPSPIA